MHRQNLTYWHYFYINSLYRLKRVKGEYLQRSLNVGSL